MNYNLEENSVRQIEEYLIHSPSLIIPVAPVEPLGVELPLHSISSINHKVAQAVSEKLQLLCASPVRYAYATPFKAFPGVLSTKRDTFVTTMADCVRSAIGWGVKKVYFVEGSSYLASSIDEAMKRYKRKFPDDFSYEIISWQMLGPVRRFINEKYTDLAEVFRSEALYAYLVEELLGYSVESPSSKAPDRELLTKWRKRGMDPEKLKAYAKDCRLSRWSGCDRNDKLLPLLVEAIVVDLTKGD